MKKSFSAIICILIFTTIIANLCLLSACDGSDVEKKLKTKYSDSENPRVTINLEDGSYINVELYPEVAPIAVKRFLDCCNDGFYNGKIFHRIVSGFVVQGGGFYMDATNMMQSSTAAYPAIKGEFSSNGVQNDLKHEFGVLAFARTGQSNDTATVQFYFCLDNMDKLTPLDGNYTTFGKIIDAQSAETLERLGKVKTNSDDVPLSPIIIRNTRIDWRKYKENYLS